ncbi:hypothetical protein Q5P01_013459 [Channa striata]|uniref:Uncharacterized protein n=1 Tax=Channa striata TaxID=64152 RepID=A0AA88MP51_CHASR|nr:hypothetical protein Q5P01_013459 [Channa striata]
MWLQRMTGLKLSAAPPSTGDSEPPAHRSDSHWEGRGLALPPLDDLRHTQFALGGFEETVVGISPQPSYLLYRPPKTAT